MPDIIPDSTEENPLSLLSQKVPMRSQWPNPKEITFFLAPLNWFAWREHSALLPPADLIRQEAVHLNRLNITWHLVHAYPTTILLPLDCIPYSTPRFRPSAGCNQGRKKRRKTKARQTQNAESIVINGIDVVEFEKTVQAAKDQPELGKFEFRN